MAKKYGNELKLFILGGIVILIIGSILFLESQKAKPVNSTAVKNLALICDTNDIIFVTYSTDYVFDLFMH